MMTQLKREGELLELIDMELWPQGEGEAFKGTATELYNRLTISTSSVHRQVERLARTATSLGRLLARLRRPKSRVQSTKHDGSTVWHIEPPTPDF